MAGKIDTGRFGEMFGKKNKCVRCGAGSVDAFYQFLQCSRCGTVFCQDHGRLDQDCPQQGCRGVLCEEGRLTERAVNRDFAIQDQESRQLERAAERNERQQERFDAKCERTIESIQEKYWDRRDLPALKRRLTTIEQSAEFVQWSRDHQKTVAGLLKEIEEDLPAWFHDQAGEAYEKGLKSKARTMWRQIVKEYPDSIEADWSQDELDAGK